MTTSQMVKAVVLGFWTLGLFFLWILWTGEALGPIQHDPEQQTAAGVVIMFTGGCCSGTWFVGILAIAAISFILRR